MPALTPTPEQADILDAAATGETVAISAGAGTGKTSTLRLIAQARPQTKMLYIAYNKAIQVEASKSFPSNVTTKTAHSLAYQEFGAPMQGRLTGPRQRGDQVAAILGIKQGIPRSVPTERSSKYEPGLLGAWTMGMVSRFCRTADKTISERHFLPPDGIPAKDEAILAATLVPYAHAAWADLTSGPAGNLKPTHDMYLKQWQLSQPQLTGWDVILYDEAQDADPAIADVVEHQHHAQLIAVGDSAQAIYGWRGAGDFLHRVRAAHRLQLTQSWRFGPAVADEANVWLDVVGTDMRISGNPARQSTIGPVARPDAILCRSNAGTVVALIEAQQSDVPVHLVGEGKEMLALARAADRMQAGLPANHPELVAFGSWQDVSDYAENDPAGSDLAVAVRIINKYGPPTIVTAIESCVPEPKATLIVSTAHKSKGLEWGRVRIASDFREPLDKKTGEPLPVPLADAMLAYVTVTRAMDQLDNTGLAWIHEHQAALADAKPGRQAPVERPPARAQRRPAPALLPYDEPPCKSPATTLGPSL